MVTGHIRKRKAKDGRTSYQIILETERDPATGKRQRFYKTINGTKKDAEKELVRMKYSLDNNGSIFAPSAIKLGDWMEEWLSKHLIKQEETTKASYRERTEKRILPYLRNIPLKHVNNSHVQDWVNQLSEEGLAPKSVKNLYLILNGAMKKAKKLNMIDHNPCDDIDLPTIERYEAEVYDTQEIQQCLNAAKGTDMYLIAVLELSLGLRRGEIAGLQWSDIDLENGMIFITQNRVNAGGKKVVKAPKSKAGRRVLQIGGKVAALLTEEHQKYCKKVKQNGFVDSGYVIHKKDGTPFSPDSLTQKWIRFRRAHNLKEIRFHDLRHTCATQMVAMKVDNKTIQARMGHADIQTTLNIYAHCLPSMNQEAGDKLDVLFN